MKKKKLERKWVEDQKINDVAVEMPAGTSSVGRSLPAAQGSRATSRGITGVWIPC